MPAYDIIGDVHGAAVKLEGLLTTLGYVERRRRLPPRRPPGPLRGRPHRPGRRSGPGPRGGPGHGRRRVRPDGHGQPRVQRPLLGHAPPRPARRLPPHPSRTPRRAQPCAAPGLPRPGGRGIGPPRLDARLVPDAPPLARPRRNPGGPRLLAPLVAGACLDKWAAPGRSARRRVPARGQHRPAPTCFDAVEIVLEGPRGAPRPDELAWRDRDGTPRWAARIRWWDDTATSLGDLAGIPPASAGLDGAPHPGLPEIATDVAAEVRYSDPVPVFFGHYWFTGTPGRRPVRRLRRLQRRPRRRSPLVAYRWAGESAPSADRFVRPLPVRTDPTRSGAPSAAPAAAGTLGRVAESRRSVPMVTSVYDLDLPWSTPPAWTVRSPSPIWPRRDHGTGWPGRRWGSASAGTRTACPSSGTAGSTTHCRCSAR